MRLSILALIVLESIVGCHKLGEVRYDTCRLDKGSVCIVSMWTKNGWKMVDGMKGECK